MGREEQRIGKDFEKIFERLALYAGLLPRKNHTACIRTKTGYRVVESQLDYRVFARDGRVGYFDLKTFAGDRFAYSDIEPHQVTQAAVCNDWRVPSGFLVWYRGPNLVSLFSGHQIAQAGPGSGFSPGDGLALGKLESMNLGLLFSK
jgi:hypothetical protein